MIIGITDNMGAEHKFQFYLDWVHRADAEATCIKLSYEHGGMKELDRCGGIILTGGGDVDPALYNGDIRHPSLYDINRKRDNFERGVIDRALDKQLPLMGICRGLQIANVHFGGTLIQDLATMGYDEHSTERNGEHRHDIDVEDDSSLSKCGGAPHGNVNSYHHQAAALPGKGLRVSARSKDGITEALEFEEWSATSFFMLIQWHPERMKDVENPFSRNILEQFFSSIHQKAH